MALNRLAVVGLAAGLLLAAAPALASNAVAIPLAGKTQQVEQLGPKHLLGPRGARAWTSPATTRAIPITVKTLEVEELGPKYLLGK